MGLSGSLTTDSHDQAVDWPPTKLTSWSSLPLSSDCWGGGRTQMTGQWPLTPAPATLLWSLHRKMLPSSPCLVRLRNTSGEFRQNCLCSPSPSPSSQSVSQCKLSAGEKWGTLTGRDNKHQSAWWRGELTSQWWQAWPARCNAVWFIEECPLERSSWFLLSGVQSSASYHHDHHESYHHDHHE